jgi:ABC-2 type transport system ATP-binding protein
MIETRGLRKVYRTKKRRQVTMVDAVRGIAPTVAEGEIFGFLGPDGAGKTTTLRMLATLLAPDGGEAIVAGADLLANPREVRRRIGYVAQSGSTRHEVSAREELTLQARMYGASKADARHAADATMDSFGLANHLGENVVWEGAIVVAALTALGLAWSTRLFARSLR